MVNVSKLKSKSVSSFVNSLRSQGSRKNYYSALKQFFEFIKPELKNLPDNLDKYTINPEKVQAIDEVSLEYVRDPEVKTMTSETDYEEDLRRFRDEELANYAGSSVKYKFRVIFRYLKVNQIEFDGKFMDNMMGPGKPVTFLVEKIPTPTQLDMILDRIDLAGRAPVLLMAKAGLRPEEAMNAKLRDLELDFMAKYVDSETGKEMQVPIAKLNIPKAKNELPRLALLIKEVEDELVLWLARREAYIEELKKKAWYLPADQEVDKSLIFPYGEATLRSMWETALKKCDLDDREDITLRNRLVYRLHNLRKFFRTYGGWENPDVAECLMGHQEGMAKIYDRKDKAIELLVKSIKQAEPNLTSRRLKSPIEALVKIDDLRAENKQARETIDKLTQKMGEMGSEIERLRAEVEAKIEQMIERVKAGQPKGKTIEEPDDVLKSSEPEEK